MINRHLLILFHVLILSCIHLGATEKTADTDSISHARDRRLCVKPCHLGVRIQEQTFINQYGLGKYGGALINQRNEIAPEFWSKYGIMESIYKKK